MNIAIYTLTSELHDEEAVGAVTRDFLNSLDVNYEFKGSDYADYGTHSLDLIYVRTGGTEGIFRRLLPELQIKSERPFYLLTSGKKLFGSIYGNPVISAPERLQRGDHSWRCRLYLKENPTVGKGRRGKEVA